MAACNLENVIANDLNKDCALLQTSTTPFAQTSEGDAVVSLFSAEDFDHGAMMDPSNVDTSGGDTNYFYKNLYTGANVQRVDVKTVRTSIQAPISGEPQEDGEIGYTHSLSFMVLNKSAEANFLMDQLGKREWVAVISEIDTVNNTSSYKVFGAGVGLRVNEDTRDSFADANGNYTLLTLATPEVAGALEPRRPSWLISINPPA